MAAGPSLVPQLPLALRFPAEQRFSRYLGAPPGLLSRLEALSLTGDGDPPYLQGPRGSGKTHLLLACCAAAEEGGRRAQYLSLRRVRGQAGLALQGLEQADFVALDDIDAIAGDYEDEVALFNLHNRLRDAGTGLAYAAAGPPTTLELALPDLRSRLAQCTLVALRTLDDAGRAELLRQRAAARGLAVDDAALQWLLTRCSRDLSGLGALFERIDAASLAAQRRITVPFLRQLFEANPG